jgi:hypothetical protein
MIFAESAGAEAMMVSELGDADAVITTGAPYVASA